MQEPGWFPDPLLHHQLRYWDGEQWTGFVLTHGVQGFDPLPPVHVPTATTTQHTVMMPDRSSRRRRRWPVVVGIGAGVLTGLVVLGNLLPDQQQATLTSAAEPTATTAPTAPTGAATAAPFVGAAKQSTGRATTSKAARTSTSSSKSGSKTSSKSGSKSTSTSTKTTAARATDRAEPAAGPADKPKPATTAPKTSTSTTKAAAATTFSNCTALRKVYPHGVGKPGAVDRTTGTPPVTNFTVSASLYAANAGSDGDGDGVACEQR